MFKWRTTARFGLLACLAATLVACSSGGGGTSQPAQGGTTQAASGGGSSAAKHTLTIAFSAEPRSVNPPYDNVQNAITVHQAIFDSFLDLDTNTQLAPRLADSWQNTSPTTWRLKLHQGVSFQNGEPFNADAAKFTLLTYRDSAGAPMASQFTNVADVNVVDPYTIDIITKTPDATIPVVLTTTFALPPKYYAESGAEKFAQAPIGTGPFAFESWQKGESIKLKKNDKWWKGPVQTDELTFTFVPEAATRVATLLSGQSDIALDIAPSQAAQVQQSSTAALETTKTYRRMFVEFNPKQPPFDDVRLRRALATAIDADALVSKVLDGHAEAANGVYPKLMPAYDPEHNFKPNVYDPAKAKALLTEAGKPDGFTFPFYYTVGRYLLDREVAEAIAAQLAAVGIKAEMHGLESGTFFDQLTAGTMPGAHMLTLGVYAPDEHRLLRVHFWSRGTYKYSVDPTLDDMITKGLSTFDRAERTTIYKEAEKRIIEDQVYWKPLYLYEAIYGVSKKVQWQPYSDEFIRPELIKW